jgi:hypothetical protein
MTDQVWGIGNNPFNVVEGPLPSPPIIATITLAGGNTEVLYSACRIGQDGYLFGQHTGPSGSVPGQQVFRVSGLVQAAVSPSLGPVALVSLYNGGVATDGTFVYALSWLGLTHPTQISVLDPLTLAVLGSATVGPADYFPFAPAYANGRVFSGIADEATFTSFSVLAIDAVTLAATAIPVGSVVRACVASPDQSKVYALGNGVVYVIDTTTLSFSTKTVSGAFAFGGGVTSPDGAVLWLSDGATVFVLDTATFAILHAISLHGAGLAMSSDATTVYVAGGSDYAINTSTFVATPIFNADAILNWLIVPPTSAVAPPLRQKPRNDNLALGAARQRVGAGQPSSRQYSYRQGIAGTYS